MRRSRPCLAEPPAESPSTRKISVDSRSRLLHSASFPGRPPDDSAVLRRTSSRDFFAASRAPHGQGRLLDHLLGDGRVLLEVGVQPLGDRLLHRLLDLAATQVALGLAAELRLGHAHADDGGQALAPVVAAGDLALLDQLGALREAVQRAGQRRAEGGQVRAALVGVDRVDERVHVLGVRAVVLDGHVHLERRVLGLDRDGRGVDDLLALVEVLGEGRDAALVLEVHLLLAPLPLVHQADAHAAGQERQLAQALGHRVEVEDHVAEDVRVGRERDQRPFLGGLVAGFHLLRGVALGELHRVDTPVAVRLDAQLGAECVHHRDAHTVQAARDLVGLVVELPARVQRGHDDLERGLAGLVHADGDAAAVVAHRAAAVGAHGDGDRVAAAGHGLVDGVVHHLEDQVVQPLERGVRDVHAGALAHRLEPLEHLDLVGPVLGGAALGGHVGLRRGLGVAGGLGIAHGGFPLRTRRGGTSGR